MSLFSTNVHLGLPLHNLEKPELQLDNLSSTSLYLSKVQNLSCRELHSYFRKKRFLVFASILEVLLTDSRRTRVDNWWCITMAMTS